MDSVPKGTVLFDTFWNEMNRSIVLNPENLFGGARDFLV